MVRGEDRMGQDCADAEGDIDVTFGGDISITFTSASSQPIYVIGSTAHVTVEDNAKLFLGTAECPLIENGLQVGSDTFSAITITDNALVEAVADVYNVKALCMDYDNGSLIISGNATVNSNGGGVSSENVTISGGFASKYASVSFEGALAVNYYFTPSVDADEMNLYYWSPSIYEWVDALTPETALGCVQMEKQANGSYWAQLTYLPAKWIDRTIYVAATYEKDGVTYCTGIIAYSVSTYCSRKADGPMGGLAFATAAYGYYAGTYFSA